jgi:hypothetical protein
VCAQFDFTSASPNTRLVHLRPALNPRNLFSEVNRYQTIVFAFCFAFGIAMIANANCTADGVWFGYAVLYNHGMRLYSQLHFIQQPLFVLETAWFMDLLGNGWLVSKVPAVLHVAIYSLGLLCVVRQLPLSDRQKAVLLGAAFFLTVNSVAYRFDDYHVLAETFVLYSAVLLLKLHWSNPQESHFGLLALLGLLAGLAFETRITNGAALFVAAVIAIFCFLPNRKLISLACFSAAALLTVPIVAWFTGDAFRVYWMASVMKAAGSKGGTGNVLMFPLKMPWTTVLLFHDHHRSIALVAIFVSACLVGVYLIRPAMLMPSTRTIGRAGIALLLLLLAVCFMYNRGLKTSVALLSMSAVALFLIYGFGVIAAVRMIVTVLAPNRLQRWNRLEILFLVPLGQLACEAMSSGGRIGEFYTPLAIFILLLPIASPINMGSRGRAFLFSAATILFGFGCVHRVMEPLRWLNEVNQPMFVGRQWFMHPVYGPMIIERNMLAFIEPVCKTVNNGGPDAGLLSLPYSYANYFCAVPPWHNHVQTWYDTASEATVGELANELHAPPKWILYQSQPETLRIHENVFNHGASIPYRDLDQMIQRKMDDGSWKVAYKSGYGGTREWTDAWLGQEWFLIQTRP